MTAQDIDNLKQYKDYPEGSLSKKSYDRHFIPFADFLRKYYSNVDLQRWRYWTDKFVNPLFDDSNIEAYFQFLHAAKPSFFPDKQKANIFFHKIKDDIRFDNELKFFFAFLFSIDFFKTLTFEEWLMVKYWQHPLIKEQYDHSISVTQILNNEFGSNYLKEQLVNLELLNGK